MTKKDRWQRTQRKPDKIIREVRRSVRDNDCSLVERQNGSSHWCGKIYGPNGNHRGTLTLPRHGEIPKGTWSSIYGMIVKLGLAVVILGAIGGLLIN